MAYASKSLSGTECRYCTTKCELLAGVQFATVTFRNYLPPEDEFIICTDHASLIWLMNFREAEGLIGHWFQSLSDFHLEIQHRKGQQHGSADALSRSPPHKCSRADCPECRPSFNFQQNFFLAYMQFVIPPRPMQELSGVQSLNTINAAEKESWKGHVNCPMGWSHDDL